MTAAALHALSNDDFDALLAAAIEDARITGAETTDEVEDYFAERRRRIEARQAEIAAAEAEWEAELDAIVAEAVRRPKPGRYSRYKAQDREIRRITDEADLRAQLRFCYERLAFCRRTPGYRGNSRTAVTHRAYVDGLTRRARDLGIVL